jgi:gamma-glutamyltranspeptidase/glutathione hydrolase
MICRFLHTVIIIALAGVLSAGCRHVPVSAHPDAVHVARGTIYMVAADHPLASRTGESVLARGGNAVDAAVATSFALCVTRPYSTGIGGGGFMMIKRPGGAPLILDYRETAPAACRPDAYLDEHGKRITGRSVRGPWAVGVPGLLRGLSMALADYGTMPLAELMQPAIDLAEKGFAIDAHTHSVLKSLATHAALDSAASANLSNLLQIYLENGRAPKIGSIMRQPELARTLRTIARDGVETFYTGDLARTIVAEIQERNGPMVAEDLADYRVQIRDPLIGSYRGYSVAAMPPPSSGGACLIQMLKVIEGFDSSRLDPASRYHVLAEAMKHAYADRSAYLGDADATPGILADVERMISPQTVATIQNSIDLSRTHRDPLYYGTSFAGGDAGTTHYCVIDANGMAVSATETINYPFGAYVVVPGTGIVLNNELDDFTISDSPTNAYGLAYSRRNEIGPGRRPLSSMSPTLLLKGDDVVIAAGASGGQRIITATLQSIIQVAESGLDAGQAVAAPRIHHQWIPDRLYLDDGIPENVRQALRTRGHDAVPFRYHSGVCQMIHVVDGVIYGVSDPRKGGQPAGK